jgi:hypothetical protein
VQRPNLAIQVGPTESLGYSYETRERAHVQQRPNLAIQVGPTESLDYSHASQAILRRLGSRSNQGDATIDADTDTDTVLLDKCGWQS